MGIDLESFQLDHSIFNDTLYNELHDFWFDGIAESNTSVSKAGDGKPRWSGPESAKEMEAFDSPRWQRFKHAIETLGPTQLRLPSFKSDEEDARNAERLASTFLPEVKAAQSVSQEHGAEILLSLVLLLDQFPRNLYPSPDEWHLVFRHYDRLAQALVRSTIALQPSPIDVPAWRDKPIYRQWILLPLIHCEHLSSHEYIQAKYLSWGREYQEAKDEVALRHLRTAQAQAARHLDPVRRFGRYPYRNASLGRRSTAEEDDYLRTPGAYGAKTQQE